MSKKYEMTHEEFVFRCLNAAANLYGVLTHLKLPTELPIRLSFADQARFAAETIRRLDANGKFGSIHY